jgi:F420-dependent oxidoreductase-like protein
MRLGLNIGYSGPEASVNMPLILEAERLGFHSVWAAEAWGSDVITPAVWIAAKTSKIHVGTAVMQIAARTPALAAMTAMTIDQLSGGRFLMGIGASGPQVVEGWHGVPYGKPVTRIREYVEILRRIWAREEPLEHEGFHYQIPYRGPGASGLGKPLKTILHAQRQIPIYVGATGPKSIEQTAEIADGWLPVFYSPYRAGQYRGALEAGFRKAGGGKDLENFDVAPSVIVIQGEDVSACLEFVKPFMALYVGGMGARGRNFYNDIACRYGYEEAARKIQDLYLDGKKAEATTAVPNELADEVSLCGPPERICDRIVAWKESGASTLLCSALQVEALRTMAKAVL